MLLYHGSNVLVSKPKIIRPSKTLDFGAGFYLTSSYEQAQKWARNQTLRRNEGKPVVSVFEVEEQELFSLNVMKFQRADKSWLAIITANRTNISHQMEYDVIIGPVADDDTFPVISDYIRGKYTEKEALSRLLPRRFKDQYVFKTAKSLETLKFLRGDDC